MARITRTALWLAGFLAICAALASPPPDGIDLRVNEGPGFDDVTLAWTGGTPTFSIYASFNPASVVQPANSQAVVGASPWTDVGIVVPSGTVRFYLVIVTPPTCGNGSVEAAEGCDDGNVLSGDGCSGTCVVETGSNCVGSPSVCTAICGDGLIRLSEQCDDGDLSNGDGCSSSCLIEPGFQCEFEPSMCGPLCGDGIVLAGLGEQCDDGNLASNDGCSSGCAVETGFTCTGQPSVCQAICGDGIIRAAETCDDANLVDNDGCSSGCAVETGFTCAGQPSVCQAICGDGIIRAAETCDDANLVDNDGCSSGCAVETGFTCAGQPSVCQAICGDNLLRGLEQCDDGNVVNGDGCSATCQIETGCALLRVNELVTATTASANDEFIELFNPCFVPVNLNGWRLVYRSAAGTTDSVLVNWTGTVIPARSYLLYVSTAYGGGANDGVYNAASMSATGGGVAVRNPANAIIDSVGYGTATNIFVEGTAAPAPTVVAPPGRSIGRLPNGVDTNVNASDFHVTTAVTPRAANF